MPEIARLTRIPAKRLRLRWKMVYGEGSHADHVLTGPWNAEGPQLNRLQATHQPREGLKRAVIEAEATDGVHEILSIDGTDFVKAQWETYARFSAFADGRQSPPTEVAGYSFFTKAEKITIWVDGTWTRRPFGGEYAIPK